MEECSLEWAIYTQHEGRVINEKLNYNGDSDCESIENIINDIYFLLGLQNLVLYNENEYNLKCLVNRLSDIDDAHTYLIVFKQIINMELHETVKRSNRANRDTVVLTNEINEFLEKWLIYRYIPYEHDDYYIYNYFKDVFKPSVLRELSHIYIDYNYFYQIGNMDKMIQEKLKLYYVLKKIPLDSRGNSIIFFFFLNTIMESLTEESYHEAVVKDINNLDKILNQLIIKINEITLKHQVNLQEDMLLCYKQNPVSNKRFNYYIKDIVDTLIICEKAYKYYFSHLSTGCVATMYFENKNYFTLSGSKGDEIIDLITNGKYQKVKSTDDIRYYYDDNKYITLRKQKESFKKFKFNYTDSEINLVNRMFSCCERKLLTLIYGTPYYEEAKIFVKFKPCYMCERAIDDFIKNSSVECNIYYPKKKHVKRFNKSKVKIYDRLGEKIKDN